MSAQKAGLRLTSLLFAMGLSVAIIFAMPAARAADDPSSAETASLPPSDMVPEDEAALPRILTEADVKRYREVFALQGEAKWSAADRVIRRIQDPVLIGHVKAQRLLAPHGYRSRYDELRDWLGEYRDEPDAGRIHWLAMQRKPRRAKAPASPTYDASPNAPESGSVARRVATVSRSAHNAAERRAAQLFYRGDAAAAYKIAAATARRHGASARTAHWIAGLAAYRLGRPLDAATHFEALAKVRRLDDWSTAAAAFWVARSNLVGRKPEQVYPWLRKAASYPLTFYGLLAHRLLGTKPDIRFQPETLTTRTVTALMSHDAARRAFALLQVGRKGRAERELLPLAYSGEPGVADALIAVAEHTGLPSLALRIARSDTDPATGASRHPAALYPIPVWQPSGGFVVDRALVYAFIRQESAFNENATSRAGARGLMQLMPATARFIAGRRIRSISSLYDPTLNITLGQKYLDYLMQHETVEGDLFRLAAAYNGGPGNLARWEKRSAQMQDSLMFIESIPARETRDFIERVLSNLWIYHLRLGQTAPSLDAVAQGERPLYVSLDGTATAVARNGRN